MKKVLREQPIFVLEIYTAFFKKTDIMRVRIWVRYPVGGAAPAPPTPPEIRVVLLHTERVVQRHNSCIVRVEVTSNVFTF